VTGQRRLTELSREQSLRLLGSVSLGRLVFTYRAMPAIRPVNHLLDGGDVIIRSHTGAAVVPAAGAARGVVVAYEPDAIPAATSAGALSSPAPRASCATPMRWPATSSCSALGWQVRWTR
jgi:hypothetical protein